MSEALYELARQPLVRRAFFHRLAGRAAALSTAGWLEKEQMLLDACHPWQLDVMRDQSKRIVLLTGGRAGKTTVMRARLLRTMLRTKNARCLFIAESSTVAEELMWPQLKILVERLGLFSEARFMESKLRLTLTRNGATLRLVGADDKREIDKLRGQPFHIVAIDEAASHRPELLEYLIDHALGVRLGDYRGTLILGGTPGATRRGLFYEASKKGSERSVRYRERDQHPQREWSLHTWNMQLAAPYAEAIANAWAEAQEQKKLKGVSDKNPWWQREVLGNWFADNTLMVFQYDPEKNAWDPQRDELRLALLPEPEGEWHYAVGMDLGHSDPTAIEIFAWDDADPKRRLWHVFEFHHPGKRRERGDEEFKRSPAEPDERLHAKPLAQLFLGEMHDATRPEGLIGKIGWPDGMVAEIASLGGIVLEDLGSVYGIAIEPAEKKNRNDAITLFNGDLVDERLYILKGSKLEEQLIELQWDVDQWGNLTKNKALRDDAADAGIYGRTLAGHKFTEAKKAPTLPPRNAFDRMERQARQEEPEAPMVGGEYAGIYTEDTWEDAWP